MKTLSYFLLFLLISISCKSGAGSDELRNGDIIFQITNSRQGQAVQIATGSKYTHVGILFKKDDELLVYEAVQPVKITLLDEWIERGVDNHYVVKRLKNADNLLTNEVLAKMKNIGEKHIGKDYDSYFEWTDTRMYCSELVWKIYNQALGIEIGGRKRLGDFNIKNEIVQQQLRERYGDNIPMDEPMISPGDMFDSDLLETVEEN